MAAAKGCADVDEFRRVFCRTEDDGSWGLKELWNPKLESHDCIMLDRTSAPGSERWLRGTSKLMRARSAAGFLSCDDVVAAADGVGVEYRHELFSAINDMSVAARAEPQTH